jgi:predicted RNA-binding Zn-ribbon protein involved in translation (DUF1610 family)
VSVETRSVKISRELEIEKTPFYCPSCGRKDVWAGLSGGAHNGNYGCCSCRETFLMNVWNEDRDFKEAFHQISP